MSILLRRLIGPCMLSSTTRALSSVPSNVDPNRPQTLSSRGDYDLENPGELQSRFGNYLGIIKYDREKRILLLFRRHDYNSFLKY